MIDLSFLTEEEQEKIMNVLKRDAELKKAEDVRIRQLHENVKDENQLKNMTGEWFYEAKSKRHRDKIHGTDIIRASMKKQKPMTIYQITQNRLAKEKNNWVNSINKEVFIPAELSGVLEESDEEQPEPSTTAKQNKAALEQPQENLRQTYMSPAKQRQNPFNDSSVLGDNITFGPKSDLSMNGTVPTQSTTKGERLPSTKNKLSNVSLPQIESKQRKQIPSEVNAQSQRLHEQVPVPKPRTIVHKPQDTLSVNSTPPKSVNRTDLNGNSSTRRGILKRNSSSSSNDSEVIRHNNNQDSQIRSALSPQTIQEGMTKKKPGEEAEEFSQNSLDRLKHVRFSATVHEEELPQTPESDGSKEIGEYNLLDSDYNRNDIEYANRLDGLQKYRRENRGSLKINTLLDTNPSMFGPNTRDVDILHTEKDETLSSLSNNSQSFPRTTEYTPQTQTIHTDLEISRPSSNRFTENLYEVDPGEVLARKETLKIVNPETKTSQFNIDHQNLHRENESPQVSKLASADLSQGKPINTKDERNEANTKPDKYTFAFMRATDESISKVLDWFTRSSEADNSQTPTLGATATESVKEKSPLPEVASKDVTIESASEKIKYSSPAMQEIFTSLKPSNQNQVDENISWSGEPLSFGESKSGGGKLAHKPETTIPDYRTDIFNNENDTQERIKQKEGKASVQLQEDKTVDWKTEPLSFGTSKNGRGKASFDAPESSAWKFQEAGLTEVGQINEPSRTEEEQSLSSLKLFWEKEKTGPKVIISGSKQDFPTAGKKPSFAYKEDTHESDNNERSFTEVRTWKNSFLEKPEHNEGYKLHVEPNLEQVSKAQDLNKEQEQNRISDLKSFWETEKSGPKLSISKQELEDASSSSSSIFTRVPQTSDKETKKQATESFYQFEDFSVHREHKPRILNMHSDNVSEEEPLKRQDQESMIEDSRNKFNLVDFNELEPKEDETQTPKIKSLKSFWEKGQSGPKIIVIKSKADHSSVPSEKTESSVDECRGERKVPDTFNSQLDFSSINSEMDSKQVNRTKVYSTLEKDSLDSQQKPYFRVQSMKERLLEDSKEQMPTRSQFQNLRTFWDVGPKPKTKPVIIKRRETSPKGSLSASYLANNKEIIEPNENASAPTIPGRIELLHQQQLLPAEEKQKLGPRYFSKIPATEFDTFQVKLQKEKSMPDENIMVSVPKKDPEPISGEVEEFVEIAAAPPKAELNTFTLNLERLQKEANETSQPSLEMALEENVTCEKVSRPEQERFIERVMNLSRTAIAEYPKAEESEEEEMSNEEVEEAVERMVIPPKTELNAFKLGLEKLRKEINEEPSPSYDIMTTKEVAHEAKPTRINQKGEVPYKLEGKLKEMNTEKQFARTALEMEEEVIPEVHERNMESLQSRLQAILDSRDLELDNGVNKISEEEKIMSYKRLQGGNVEEKSECYIRPQQEDKDRKQSEVDEYELELRDSPQVIKASTPVKTEVKRSMLNIDMGQSMSSSKYSEDENSSRSATLESSDRNIWSHSESWKNSLSSEEDYSPVANALRRSPARPVPSKSLEDIPSITSRERDVDIPKEDLVLSAEDVSTVPSTLDYQITDPAKLKRLSKSVPAFHQEESDERETDSTSENSFQLGRHKKTTSSLTNLSSSSGMASLSSVSGSVMSIYSGDFGNVDVRGNIQFAIDYVEQLKEFHIFVAQCKDLAAVEVKKQRSDPYVKSYLFPDKSKMGKRKTSVKKKTLNPTYNEILRYKIDKQTLQTQKLNLSVWHNDTFGRNSFLGEVELEMANWDWRNQTMNWYPLKPRTSSFSQALENRGEMKLAVRYVPQPSQGKRNPITGEVHIWVKECRNLPLLRSSNIDPFVKCSVLPDTSRKSRQKTRVLKKTVNPEFNHTMVYDGFRSDDLREACVELTVWDHERLINHFLGGLRLGLGTGKSYGTPVDWMDSTTDEASLWEKMITSPNEWTEDVLPLRMLMVAKVSK
ncbi:microtubule-associated protein futsch isoform X2 [Latimeria chalumnae]|uniref:microtubule-associated protein futsch isoform X2 n=1 Tax=Latimeria chalumnae TaxID=7897 RepID=UPI0006D8E76A|nr:PREDICTED: synaptotagmin-like protein 2 isoform X2 [Latimeria chalumnae]|eukprot:XP_014343428.1 PREDICTED: synaptotagmin-like protein 2 isoform X2 [Latimeria chalumnae]